VWDRIVGGVGEQRLRHINDSVLSSLNMEGIRFFLPAQGERPVTVFKVCKSVHHHTIQINHQLDATISPVYYLTFIYSPTCFGRNRPDHDQQHCYHHAPKVRPEAATAVVELLMMGVRTPETR
jgi:hypothetical protein